MSLNVLGHTLDYAAQWPQLKLALDLIVYGPVAALIIGLAIQAATRTSATWYVILEKAIGVSFVTLAGTLIFFLPITAKGFTLYLGWFVLQAFLYIALPGTLYEGLPLKETGQKLKYKCNGMLAFVITFALYFLAGKYNWFGFQWSDFAAEFASMLSFTNLFSFIWAFYLFISAQYSPNRKAHNVDTDQWWSHGNFAEDLWYGVELNPLRIDSLGLDLKFWSESRPGLILWALFNISICALYTNNFETSVPIPMLLVTCFHFIYVADYFVVENYIVTTWDIFAERFGWMLLWGDYVWVPYFYVIPTWYIYYTNRVENPTWYNVLCVIVFIIGYIVFRGANRQKHKFKEDPTAPVYFPIPFKPESIEVTNVLNGRKTKLLVSGWWGLSRHANYFGDWILATSWGMPAAFFGKVPFTDIPLPGFESYIPYLYLIFMLGLLFHRFARDDEECEKKYGEDWKKYTARVPYKIIPYVF
eukprot:TRINITY_DN1353_c0_g1_i1.p1 TRINITY_DN1353_c0_g1~~TRINITY_DN1353_c0_g1_i1.p1  ORF type:complete len:473 (+),score=130.24 TRINITY_DN1353_c0_g1_i1:1770-3188(+)